MKNRLCSNLLLVCLLICSLYAIGCLSNRLKKTGKITPSPAEATAPPTIAELHLSVSKPTYGVDEAIPLRLLIQVGKFDLLVPYATVEGKGPFIKLVVKSAAGEVVRPKYPITFENRPKTLMHRGQQVSCIKGVDLKTGTEKKAVLDNLQTYYKLKPGDYALQVLMDLKIYRESLLDQSPQILEIERNIASVQRNAKLPADNKLDAIRELRAEIEFIRSEEENKRDRIYLPLGSYRGSKALESNVVSLKIQ